MTLTERTTIIGTVLGVVTFVTYWAVVVTRALTDDLPLEQVAWHGPMLLALIVGGGLYAVVYGVLAWRAQAHVHAGVGGDGRHIRAQVQPELGIFLAEADRGRPLDQPRVAERSQHALIEGGARGQVANRH